MQSGVFKHVIRHEKRWQTGRKTDDVFSGGGARSRVRTSSDLLLPRRQFIRILRNQHLQTLLQKILDTSTPRQNCRRKRL
ncbi:hypothetical protein P5673_023869 [Acropora cervicornis]|uniref:Uncharacterized protein n=1 Tax=Acropora cervicornis TaxID=6130 RepID=A0AAD9Q5B8_ACRCE|nr:hypothetical protein P5673_023869 [Acropora cervicornis]